MDPLSTRKNSKDIDRDGVTEDAQPSALTAETAAVVVETAARITAARKNDRPVIIAFGAHAIKNGLGPVFNRLIDGGWVTHLATNGAGIIHDWEFAFLGRTSEDVAANVREGRFGNWQETGFYINLALNVGAWKGLGYGESVGALIDREGLDIPSARELEDSASRALRTDPELAAASADLLHIVRSFNLAPGRLSVPHPWKQYSVQAHALRADVPFTGHPMIGHDIIYNHPMNHGASLGRAAQRDFLSFAQSVSRIEDGVYLSIGSAVMSPMIFEKSFSMAQNLAIQQGKRIERHFITVVDLAESRWDWTQGEPPQDRPEYYQRYLKTFSRMGGTMRYASADNRDFLVGLCRRLAG
jgi:hypothetical protein